MRACRSLGDYGRASRRCTEVGVFKGVLDEDAIRLECSRATSRTVEIIFRFQNKLKSKFDYKLNFVLSDRLWC